jgi:uroporphyrin-III C-methyltransferase
MNDLPFELPNFEPGWVWLAGAGPGDPALLTLGAAHGLRQADIIVYDALVNPEILKLALDTTELEYAGKRGGKPSIKQADISSRLVELAKSGKKVLRLKGGDPFVFGRGAEECMVLVEAKVPFRIVPGITSGVGGLAYAGIPMTTRGTNTAVTFITGHTATGDVPDDINWKALAEGSPVMIFYMAANHLERIASQLILAGREENEPVAIIQKATFPEQVVLETTLRTCSADLKKAMLTPPVLIVVGPVVPLRKHLNWLAH